MRGIEKPTAEQPKSSQGNLGQSARGGNGQISNNNSFTGVFSPRRQIIGQPPQNDQMKMKFSGNGIRQRQSSNQTNPNAQSANS